MKSTTHTSTQPHGFFLVFALLALIGLVCEKGWTASPPATWTKGHKKVLIIPVRFTDQTGPSDVPGPGGYLSGWGRITDGSATAEISAFFAQQSYGLTTLEFTVLPEIDLGVSYTIYNANLPGTPYSKFTLWYEPGSIADDARAKARQVGLGTGTPAMYDTDNYDLDIIACGFIPGQGTQSSGIAFGKGVFGTTFKALSHELCHNLGLQHANGVSRATLYSPVKSGTFFTDAYGDVFDLMGYKYTSPIPIPPDREVNVYWKYQLAWLPDARILNPSVSGTYRIYAFDQGALNAGNNYAMKIARDPLHNYWFDFRQAIVGADAGWSANGLEIHFGGEYVYSSSGNTMLLDMTPGSRGLAGTPYGTMHDAPLAIGRTYSDEEANLHITPIRKGGTVPESLDVVTNFGPFPGNGAPTVSIAPSIVALNAGVGQTFTATASDPDTDTLTYAWEFDDGTQPGGTQSGGLNPDATLATQGSHTWTQDGVYFVRCSVSDMKGHTVTAPSEVTVTGGSAGVLTISGVVKDELGNPLEGAIVSNFKPTAPNNVAYGAANFAGSSMTAADGKYIIPLPPIGSNTYYLTAKYKGYGFNCSVAGGAISVVASSITNVDFTRVRATRTISGSIVVAGRSYDPATDGPLTVSDGTQSVAASLGFWQMTEPDGTAVSLTATPANSSYTVFPFFANPYVVVDDFNLLHFDVKIPGKMPETGFTSAGAGSDDTVGTVNIPVTMTLPVGYSSWVSDQSVYYWIDDSSTAEYGVDYNMTGGRKTFYNNTAPSLQLIPLKIIQDSVPKSKTVVIRLGAASSITNMGPITTYTYTITNIAPTPTPTPAGNGAREWQLYE